MSISDPPPTDECPVPNPSESAHMLRMDLPSRSRYDDYSDDQLDWGTDDDVPSQPMNKISTAYDQTSSSFPHEESSTMDVDQPVNICGLAVFDSS